MLSSLKNMSYMFIHMNIPSTPVKYIDLDITWFQCLKCTSPACFTKEEWITRFYGHGITTYPTTASTTTINQ